MEPDLHVFDLTGRTALVTGGGRGLGRAIAHCLARSGARVAVAARTPDEIAHVAGELADLGADAVALECDVMDPAAVQHMVDGCTAQLGAPDIVVSNAGNALVKPLVPLPRSAVDDASAGPTTDGEWASIMGTHLTGAMHVARASVPGMLERGFGRVITISSVTTARVGKFTASYDAAKGGLISLTRSLAHEWARYGVTANVIAPGQFRTSMSEVVHNTERGREWLLSRIPMRRFGEQSEVGWLAVYLASDVSSFVTGQCIYVDGGEGL